MDATAASDFAAWLLGAVLWESFFSLLSSVLWWAALLGLLGALAGWGAYALLRRAGVWKLEWRHAVWPRAFACLWLAGCGAVSGAALGGLQGVLAGVDDVLRHGALRKDLLDPVGRAAAFCLALADEFAALPEGTPEERFREARTRAEAFERGARTFDATVFRARAGASWDMVWRQHSEMLKAEIRAHLTPAAGPLAAALAGQFLEVLLLSQMKSALQAGLKGAGLAGGAQGFLDGLPAAAAARGDSATLDFDELAAHAVERGLAPGLSAPLRGLVRGHQFTAAVLGFLGASAAPAAFALARARMSRRAAGEVSSGTKT